MKLAIICSLILSIIHSILFFGEGWGVSVLLFAITAVFLFILILGKNGKIKKKSPLILSVPIILLSSTYLLFNNLFFQIMNFFAIILLFLIMIIWACTGELNPGKLIKNMCILFFAPITELVQVGREISNNFHVDKKEGKTKKSVIWKIIKALLISFPIVIVVIALLITADDAFGGIFKDLIDEIFSWLNLGTLYKITIRIMTIVLFTFYFMGVVLKVTRGKVNNDVKPDKKGLRIEGMTLGLLITLLNIVYLIFSGIQIIHIIGQISISDVTNYAGYAREGFFQLMLVSFINFVIILLSKLNKKEMGTGARTYIKSMNFILALFTVVLLVTSVIRMTIYAQEYGYTFLRVLVFITQITELLLIIPTLIYIISNKFKVAKWYLGIIVIMYVAFNFMNVDHFIAKQNIDRYLNDTNIQTRKIDFDYLRRNTSTDAISEIIRLYNNTKDEKTKRDINNYLYKTKKELVEEEVTWQSFNLSKFMAKLQLEKMDLKYQYYDKYYENNHKSYNNYDDEEYNNYYDDYYLDYYSNYANDYYTNFIDEL